MRPLTLEYIKDHTKKITKGMYKCISEEDDVTYPLSKCKIEFMCPEGHKFSMLWSNFSSSGKRCPECYNLNDRGSSQRFDIQYVIKQTRSISNCECLSKSYINAKTKLKWRCPEGHVFEKTWDKFRKQPTCNICSPLRKKTIEEIKQYAEESKYECISDTYINAKTKLKWRCPEGHVFEMSWNCFQRGERCLTCSLRAFAERVSGPNHHNWKGGVTEKNLPLYDTYAPQLEWCEEVRRNAGDPNILEVKCFKCNEWFIPTITQINKRLQSLKKEGRGYCLFYCSENCKYSCSVYHKTAEQLMKEDAIRAGRLNWIELNREVQPELRQMVLERDGYKCVKCGSKGPLHCHHILPVAVEPLLSADVDNCITLCEECHKAVHKLPGCGYNEIKTEEVC